MRRRRRSTWAAWLPTVYSTLWESHATARHSPYNLTLSSKTSSFPLTRHSTLKSCTSEVCHRRHLERCRDVDGVMCSSAISTAFKFSTVHFRMSDSTMPCCRSLTKIWPSMDRPQSSSTWTGRRTYSRMSWPQMCVSLGHRVWTTQHVSTYSIMTMCKYQPYFCNQNRKPRCGINFRKL